MMKTRFICPTFSKPHAQLPSFSGEQQAAGGGVPPFFIEVFSSL